MKGKKLLVLLAALMLFVLTGCGLKSPEQLYTLPKPSTEYESLQDCLEQLLAGGYEYAAPRSGANTQSVQLQDMDGDGNDEAVAFFRDTTGGENPLKICVFRFEEDTGFVHALTIEGEGDSINSVVYCQLNDKRDNGGKTPMEIVVGWRISTTVYTLSAYSIENDNVTELLSVPGYTLYSVKDLDQDNQAEIVSVLMSSAEGEGNVASYYNWAEDTMMFVNTIPLSASGAALDSLRYGHLVDGYPALYVNAYHRSSPSNSYIITDILTVVNGLLKNITINSFRGDSDTNHLAITDLKDINSDHVLELPMPQPLNSVGEDTYNIINWVQYSVDGVGRSTGYTYHNLADEWYFMIPSSWLGTLSLKRFDTNSGATVERSITFYYHDAASGDEIPFLNIYKNTGSNRVTRATQGERFLLTSDSAATYSAELLTVQGSQWDCGLDAKAVAERFHLILTDWSTE